MDPKMPFSFAAIASLVIVLWHLAEPTFWNESKRRKMILDCARLGVGIFCCWAGGVVAERLFTWNVDGAGRAQEDLGHWMSRRSDLTLIGVGGGLSCIVTLFTAFHHLHERVRALEIDKGAGEAMMHAMAYRLDPYRDAGVIMRLGEALARQRRALDETRSDANAERQREELDVALRRIRKVLDHYNWGR